MAKEIQLTRNKKEVLPSKTTINLFYRDEKKLKSSTIALYAVFFLVVGLGLGKWLVFDPLVDLYTANSELNKKQDYLEEQVGQLGEYKEISELYARYTYTNLQEDEMIIDRMQVLEMLENTVFAKARISNLMITDAVVTLDYSGLNLDETSKLVKQLEGYEIVERVAVNAATSSEKIRMVITLIDAEEGGAES